MSASAKNAWAAGLFEGEGYISKPERKSGRTLVLGMCDEDVVRRFQEIVGVGRIVFLPARHDRHRPMWRWECSRWSEIEPLLRSLYPHFGARRRAQADAALANPAYRPRTHCLRGHELTPENTMTSCGRRRCRTCARKYEQDRRAAGVR